MANTVVVSVGADITKPGKFYWDIKNAALDKLYVCTGFKTAQDAVKDFEIFRVDLAKAKILLNP